jgi:ELWxxDGT repeat protein
MTVLPERKVWSSDGTEQGTQLLKNIGPGNSLARFLGVLNDKLLFTAYDNSNGK